jgi:ATP-binding cassette subfamily F protein 3
MVTKIVEIANLKIYHWVGNYDSFLEQKEMRDGLQQRSFENQQQYIKEQQKFIDRFRAKASKATAVQSRVKMLDKLDLIGESERDTSGMNLKFTVKKPSGKLVASLTDVHKQYGDQVILNKSKIELERGDKVALIGANGKGKSTVLRIIAGTEPFKGKRENTFNVITSFYAQHQLESLHLENEVLQELKDFAPHKLEGELRSVLGCFLFHGDDVFKKIKVLSGGEKARVALAKTLVSEANFLLLDEPTNHLDMQSVEILIQALQNYEGTFVVVSHDRYFLSQISNKIWWIEDHELKDYPGTYDEWEVWNKKRNLPVSNKNAQKIIVEEKKQKHKDPEDKERQKQKRMLEKQLEDLETELTDISSSIQKVEEQLRDPKIITDHKQMHQLASDHQNLLSKKETKSLAYDEVLEQLIGLEE